jgi:5S rRNA maturation endonuclease (ribonuclease M5)|tara:strand:+ start:1392 stop:1805 length:414 start_codon:yes stop_codon:yes gene_type:complete
MVNRGRQSSQGRLDYFNRIWDMMKEFNAPVIIEGKRDTIALRNLGYEGDLVELNDGKSILSTVENLVHKYGRGSNFIILMDWDRTGEKLAAKLKNYGDSCDLVPNLRIRKELSVLCSKDITCIEELPTFVKMLKLAV